ncbi:hypothetical protein [Vibrio algivorus]|uniref:BIG2 domain-containing protein n=1 Tax=Vibrio algivorus TaxID=1667024 RepID=A0A557PAX1_9VIBR|nr:hypothetical protein [Vibrio algivorus]TVO37807.1 hypothetical protein FOF44_05915 [Vibrio algivorus]
MGVSRLVLSCFIIIFLLATTGCDNSTSSLPSQSSQEPIQPGHTVKLPDDNLTGEDDGADEEPNAEDSIILTALTVSPSSSTVATTEHIQFQATASYSDNSSSIVTDEVIWESGDTNLISILDSGIGTAISAGNTLIRATLTQSGVTKSSEVAVTITGPTLVAITVSPKKFLLPASVKKPLTAIAQYSDGTTENITDQVTWSASATTLNNPFPPVGSDPIFVTVDENGVVFCDEFDGDDDLDNDTTITATYQGMQDTAQLTVFGAAVGAINVTPTVISLEKGFVQQFTATALLGMQGFASSTDVTQVSGDNSYYSDWGWSSSDPSVVSIDRLTGVATVLRATATPVEITFDRENSSGFAMLQISDVTLESITIEPLSNHLLQGTTERIQILASYSNGTVKDISAQPLLTLSANDESIINIMEDNQLYANQEGVTSLVASFDGITSAPVEITVEDIALESISVEPTSLSLAKGTYGQLMATATYSDGTIRDITRQANWITAESDAVSVNGFGKVITNDMPSNANSVEVRVTFRGHGSTSSIMVKDVAPLGLDASVEPTQLSVGEKGKITITATFADGTSQDVTESAFITSYFAPLTVTRDGVIEAWVEGDYFLIYGYGFSYGYTSPGVYDGVAFGYDYGYDIALPSGDPTPFGTTETVVVN